MCTERYRVSSGLYQGLVPKLLGPHADEMAMSHAFGMDAALQVPVSYGAGLAEIMFGFCVALLPRRAWPHLVSIAAMAILLAFVAIYAPRYLVGAFNPVIMNTASIALSVVALLAMQAQLPSSDEKA